MARTGKRSPNWISQREARRIQRELTRLQSLERDRLNEWARDYPGGTLIATVGLSEVGYARVTTARKLGYTLVATSDNANELRLYAVKPIGKD